MLYLVLQDITVTGTQKVVQLYVQPNNMPILLQNSAKYVLKPVPAAQAYQYVLHAFLMLLFQALQLNAIHIVILLISINMELIVTQLVRTVHILIIQMLSAKHVILNAELVVFLQQIVLLVQLDI